MCKPVLMFRPPVNPPASPPADKPVPDLPDPRAMAERLAAKGSITRARPPRTWLDWNWELLVLLAVAAVLWVFCSLGVYGVVTGRITF